MSVYHRYRIRDDGTSCSGYDGRRRMELKEPTVERRGDPLASPHLPLYDTKSPYLNLPAGQTPSTTTDPTTTSTPFVDPFGPALPTPTDPRSASKVDKVNLVGGILGGIIAVLIVGGILFFFYSRSRQRQTEKEEQEKESTLPLEKVVLPPMPDLVARPFTPDRLPSILIPPGLKINVETPLTSKQSPLPSSTYSPVRSSPHIQSPSTDSKTRQSPLTREPEAPSSSFLDLSQTPASSSVLDDTDSCFQPSSPPPIPTRCEVEERISGGSTRPLNLKPKPQARKGKPSSRMHRLSRVLHIRPRDHREQVTTSRTGSDEDAPPPAYSEPVWSFWDGENPTRRR